MEFKVLRELLKKAGIKPSHFANDMGTSPQRIAAIMSGRSEISIDYAKKLAEKLGMSVKVEISLLEEGGEVVYKQSE